ncbi:hypothetical protein HF923_03875 [Acidithiobacillus ferriphilus]|uniref:hypothetical protein n=1 Tax=Acidithiobacillus ferriphilus TaxID=1689834 RepID=UPI001C0696C2|nr:hypothetical protein [Acidithiobacillus ferriphilus]MBU2844980.1 hypothetical protein [Acidithiobacillus ferriphilus]
MDLPTATQHQASNELPYANQETVSVAAISHRDHFALDFTTHTGSHLDLHVPQFLFDALCARLGNAYKAGCWVAARCGEVDSLSRQSIERYVNIMTCDKLGLERSSSTIPRITVSSITAPEPSAKDRSC